MEKTKISLEELMVQAYKLGRNIQIAQVNLQAINREIAERENEAMSKKTNSKSKS